MDTGIRRLEARRVAPERRDEPPPEHVPAQATLRGSTLQSAKRPLDEFTIEEQRLHLAAIAGPDRLFAAKFMRVPLTPGNPVRVARGVQHIVKFVRVFAAVGSPANAVFFSSNGSGSPNTSVRVVLGTPLAGDEERFFDAILLPNEFLYAHSEIAYALKVAEVTP